MNKGLIIKIQILEGIGWYGELDGKRLILKKTLDLIAKGTPYTIEKETK